MYSSYLGVPGRGGASDGRPPAQVGMMSAVPAASFSLIVPHPLKAKPASESATMVAIWRGGGGGRGAGQALPFLVEVFGAGRPPPTPPLAPPSGWWETPHFSSLS